jgi:hypothetical protein
MNATERLFNQLPSADDTLRQAIYDAYLEVAGDSRLNHEDEIRRLVTIVETTYWNLVNSEES